MSTAMNCLIAGFYRRAGVRQSPAGGIVGYSEAMTGERMSRWLTVAVLALVTTVHLREWMVNRNPMNPDSGSYIEPATHLLSEGAFATHDRVAYAVPPQSFPAGALKAETIRTPVYPL